MNIYILKYINNDIIVLKGSNKLYSRSALIFISCYEVTLSEFTI